MKTAIRTLAWGVVVTAGLALCLIVRFAEVLALDARRYEEKELYKREGGDW
jgi:hypothetical protein